MIIKFKKIQNVNRYLDLKKFIRLCSNTWHCENGHRPRYKKDPQEREAFLLYIKDNLSAFLYEYFKFNEKNPEEDDIYYELEMLSQSNEVRENIINSLLESLENFMLYENSKE